jgi:hypothetical protein
MYATYASSVDESGLLDEPQERTSDIPPGPAVGYLLLAMAAPVCGRAGSRRSGPQPVAGAVVVAIPTFVGMVIKPTFALCILMLVLPTGAGVAWQQAFSLDRAVGLAVAVSFFLNVLLTRPGLRIRHKALWVAAGLSLWIGLTSLVQPHLADELRRAFTQFQLVLLIVIVYWILETNDEHTFRWALRCYTAGMLGSVARSSRDRRFALCRRRAMRATRRRSAMPSTRTCCRP